MLVTTWSEKQHFSKYISDIRSFYQNMVRSQQVYFIEKDILVVSFVIVVQIDAFCVK